MFGIGAGVGLVVSGFIVENLSYQWIFWIALIVAGLTLLASWRWVPASPIRNPARIDWLGAGLLAAGLAALLIAISELETWGWTSGRTLGLLAGSLILLAIWAVYENGRGDPLVDMRLLRERGVPTTNLSSALMGFGMFAAFIIIPQFVQTPEQTGTGFSASVIQAGLFMLPMTTMMLLAGPAAGVVASRRGAKLPMALGGLLMFAGFIWLAFLHGQPWEVIAGTAIMGWGLGAAFASMANLIVELVPQSQTGEATGMNTIMRTVGGALGTQIAASILAHNLSSNELTTTDHGFTVAFALTGFVVLSGAFVSVAIPSGGRGRAAVAPTGRIEPSGSADVTESPL
jgi:MFS family permease